MKSLFVFTTSLVAIALIAPFAPAFRSLTGDTNVAHLKMGLVNIKSLYSDGPDLEMNRANIQENLKRHFYFIDHLAADGVEFVGFPELSINGYHFSKNMTWLKLDGPEVKALQKKAIEKGVYISVGLAIEDTDGKRWNIQIVIDPQGRIVGLHRKIWLTQEKGHVEPGIEHKVFDVKGLKMGIAICADGTDRKNLKALVDNGAQIIYGPHANTTGGTIAGWYRFRSAWSGPDGWIAQLKVYAALHNHAAHYNPEFAAPAGKGSPANWASGAWFIGPDGKTLAQMPSSTQRGDSKEFVLIYSVPIVPSAEKQTNKKTPRSPIIDAHMHVWSDDTVKFPFTHPYDDKFMPLKIPASVQLLLKEMDEYGIDQCVLVQTIYHGWDNRYLVECLKPHPKRFLGQGLIDPTDPQVTQKLEFWMRKHGLAGVRFSPMYYQGKDEWLNAKANDALWQKAQELGAVFNFFIASQQLPKLEDMVRRHPKVKVVIDHVARVDLDAENPEPEIKKLLALARYPNVSVKISELSLLVPSKKYPYRETFPLVKRVYDAFGPDRLLWGTGFPGATRGEAGRPSLQQELAIIQKELPFLTPQDRAKILGENAARVWGFDRVRDAQSRQP